MGAGYSGETPGELGLDDAPRTRGLAGPVERTAQLPSIMTHAAATIRRRMERVR